MNNSNTYDAIIIGGGPGGSTAATVLAQRGRNVLIIEREKFPRYRLGESLIPYCYFPLERIGMIDKMRASHFVRKFSVQFVSTDGRASQPFYFFKHVKHESSMTWQVVRSEFDQMLLDNARDHGAHVMEETSAKQLIVEDGNVVGVEAVNAAGERLTLRAPMTIDATGRDMFTIKRNDWRVNDPELRKVAIWTYYKGAKRDPGIDEGNTTVAYVPEKGWFWYIPLPDDMVSVGIVAEREYLYRDGKQDLETIFQREVNNNVWLKEHLEVGEHCDEYRVTGDYSYRSEHCAANGLILVGDAFAFLDPVFSSGVFLALRSGELAGDYVEEALKANDFSAGRFDEYGRLFRDGVEAMRKLVYAFYDHSFSFGKMLKAHPEVHGDLTDCLIGHVYKDLDPLFNAVAEFADIPEALTHGTPLTEDVAA